MSAALGPVMSTFATGGRRRFLRGSLALLGAATGATGRPAWVRERPAPLVVREAWAFGTRVRISIAGLPPAAASAAAQAALARIAQVQRCVDLHHPASALARLNRSGALLAPASDLTDLRQLLRAALNWSARSGGAFDPTVQPLWQLHLAASVAGRAPDPGALEQALQLRGWRQVVIDEAQGGLQHGLQGLRYGRAGMACTLNGIAQGYASDMAWAELRRHGVRHALVDAGEFRAAGRGPGGRHWGVGLRAPGAARQARRQGPTTLALLDLVELQDAALASSADDGFVFNAERGEHHILDPANGHSPRELAAVTVWAGDACSADALSTALMVMGAEQGLAWLAGVPGAEALLVRKNGERLASAGWPGRD